MLGDGRRLCRSIFVKDTLEHLARLKISSICVALIWCTSVLLYSASLLLPCFGPDNSPGFGLLLFGILGIFCGEYSWLANPSYAIASVCLIVARTRSNSADVRRWGSRFAILFSAAGVLFAGIFLAQDTTYYGDHPVGQKTKITSLLVGYWTWLSSNVLLLFVTTILHVFVTEEPESTANPAE